MGPTQLAEVLRQLPQQTHPDLLVGFDTKDDAGVIRVPGQPHLALIQTMDFFTPVVDDPYSYGAIAAANALSDVYAMGGQPLTVMNICCFDPEAAPAEVWANVLLGMAEKCAEAGAMIVGGHSVEDDEPKFGLSVTGTVAVNRVFANSNAFVGERIFLSKPLGSGIATTAAKFDKATPEQVQAMIDVMAALNARAMEVAQATDVRCATDITGFGLVGHLWNIARASGVRIEVDAGKLPLLEGTQELVERGCITGGSRKNRDALGENLIIDQLVPKWLVEVVVDPQTSGGLAVTTQADALEGYVEIGRVIPGEPGIAVLP